jgi:hypothetical protein
MFIYISNYILALLEIICVNSDITYQLPIQYHTLNQFLIPTVKDHCAFTN